MSRRLVLALTGALAAAALAFGLHQPTHVMADIVWDGQPAAVTSSH